METARRNTATTPTYSHGSVIGKMEQLLSLGVDESNERNIPLRPCFLILKMNLRASN
jgi:hypothetical protein